MKRIVCLLLTAFLAVALPCSVQAVRAAAEEGASGGETPTVNLFANQNDWKHNKSGSNNADCVLFEGGKLKVTPKYVVGSAYCAQAMGQGRISFTYRVSYPGFPIESEEDLQEQLDFVRQSDFFFGVLFSNSPRNVKPSANLAIPFNDGAGGYPYMVAFDTEKQNADRDPVRNKQLGLTLRRYKYEGSHDFTRWSSVEPTEKIYYNADGQPYQSKIPDYHRPVTIEDCYDVDEHRVDIDITNLYKEKGDAVDAVRIEVYFDNELSLRVIDEMPFESDGYEETTDKRAYDGYLSVYAYGGTTDVNTEYEDFAVTFTSFTAQFKESNGALPVPTEEGGAAWVLPVAVCVPVGAVLIAGAVVAVLLLKKKKGGKAAFGGQPSSESGGADDASPTDRAADGTTENEEQA